MTARPAGCFVPVVGPSGVGKDTLISAVRGELAGDDRFVFVRRVVTRAAGGNEDHATMEPDAFEAAARDGAFALHWGAHGLHYGIPVSTLEDVRSGRLVVANLSRAALDAARIAFPRVRILNITAPRDVLAARLAGRGRESTEEIARRLDRSDECRPVGDDVVDVENDGPLPIAIGRMHAALRLIAATAG